MGEQKLLILVFMDKHFVTCEAGALLLWLSCSFICANSHVVDFVFLEYSAGVCSWGSLLCGICSR